MLTGRAEKLYELLSAGERGSFTSAMEALQKHLMPANREAFKSAQPMRWRQQTNEFVDEFAQDLKRLFEQSYNRRQGMDESSCVHHVEAKLVYSRSTANVASEGSAFSREVC